MSIPAYQGCQSSSIQRFVNLSMMNAIYRFGKKSTCWSAAFPGNFVPMLTCEGKCLCLEGKTCSLDRSFTIYLLF